MKRLPILVLLLLLCGHPLLEAQLLKTTKPSAKQKMSSTAAAETAKPLKVVRPLLMQPAKIKAFKPLNRVIPGKLVQPKGPTITPILDLQDSIDDSDLMADLTQACGWNPHMIFQDKAAGHVFYYLPREFLLFRDDGGYGLSVQYNTRTEAGQPSVLLTAELKAPHRKGDTQLLKAIMREALRLKVSDPLEIRSLKGIGASADMEALSAGLSLAPEQIHLQAPADFKQSFRLTLSLTQEQVEEVLALVAREGLAGTLHIKVGEDTVPVPIRIQYARFAGNRLLGLDDWVENRPLDKVDNVTDFPLRLVAIKGYRMKQGMLERVSKQLKPTKAIPAGGSRAFKLPAVERVLAAMSWRPGCRLRSMPIAWRVCSRSISKSGKAWLWPRAVRSNSRPSPVSSPILVSTSLSYASARLTS